MRFMVIVKADKNSEAGMPGPAASRQRLPYGIFRPWARGEPG